MILILTTEAGDFSHPKFIDWLHYYKADYKRFQKKSAQDQFIKTTYDI